MAERVWERFLTEQDKAHLAQSPPVGRYGFGSRAAVLSIDNYRKAVGDEPEDILTALDRWSSSTGLAGWAALAQIERLFAAARAAAVPIIHVVGLSEEESGMPGWGSRIGGRHAAPDRSAEAQDRHRRRFDIVEQAAPVPGEVVLKKTGPSAFFGTPLMAHLNGAGIDTLICVGQSASGCVRSTVVDGCSLRLSMVVVEECVYDRHESSLAMSLFDMDQKYGDVLGVDEVLGWIEAHPGGTGGGA